jgi:hypothetical protein
MALIAIETESIQEIMKSLEEIKKKLDTKKKPALSERWFDNQVVCKLLNISKRTLQHYRDSSLLPFSQIGAKIYYKASDIEAYLNKHYNN